MRLLHTSDWHLGRVTYNVSRAPDHDIVIREIVALAREVRPHLICHTGDLFDSPRPAYPDMQRGIEALRELATIAPVVVICGNHDSPSMFRIFQMLLGESAEIRFIDRARLPDDGGILEYPGDGDEVIRIAPLPFVHANRIVEHFEDPVTWMSAYADRIHLIEEELARGLERGYDPRHHVLLFAAHLFVSGATFSRSERPLTVTDAYASRLERLPRVSYAAFGHIHKPQALPGSLVTGRYAGSPIQLDFGEEGEEKVTVTVEAEPGRPAQVRTHLLSGGRPLRRLTGTLAEIGAAAPSVGRALCLVTVKTETPTPDVADQVRELLPTAVLLQVDEDCAATRLRVVDEAQVGVAESSFREMFGEYLQQEGTSGTSAERVLEAFEVLLTGVEEGTASAFPEQELLAKMATGPES